MEGIPTELRGNEIQGTLQHMETQLLIPLQKATAAAQISDNLRHGHLQRIPNSKFATTITTGAHNLTGHHHGLSHHLAVRIIPCAFNRLENHALEHHLARPPHHIPLSSPSPGHGPIDG